jgi:prevent-host-death family protein
MITITATKARSKLYQLINQAVLSHEPIIITSKVAETGLRPK